MSVLTVHIDKEDNNQLYLVCQEYLHSMAGEPQNWAVKIQTWRLVEVPEHLFAVFTKQQSKHGDQYQFVDYEVWFDDKPCFIVHKGYEPGNSCNFEESCRVVRKIGRAADFNFANSLPVVHEIV